MCCYISKISNSVGRNDNFPNLFRYFLMYGNTIYIFSIYFQPVTNPVRYEFVLQSDDASGIKLDFTFDAELAKYAEEKSELEKEEMHASQSPINMGLGNVTSTNQNIANNQPTSPMAQDLNMKIAKVKTVWDTPDVASVNNVFDQRSVDCLVCYLGFLLIFWTGWGGGVNLTPFN